MLIRQSKNTFIRSWNDLAYVENQVNHVSKTFIDKERDFILSLSRFPQNMESILNNLSLKNVRFEATELSAFIEKLEKLWFAVTGESEDELFKKEKTFSYAELGAVQKAFEPESQTAGADTKDAPWLRSLQLEVTTLCNEKCIHCYIPSETKEDGVMMPLSQVKAIIDSFVRMSGLRIILSGGEPFLHKDIIEILTYCREKDLMIFIHSNVSLLNAETLKFIKELNVFNIQVSLYSMDEAVHDNITGVKGSWIKTKNNIEALVADNVPLIISCPVLRQNYRGYKELFKYAQGLNVFCYVDYVLLAQNNLCTNNLCTRITLEQTGELLDDIIDTNPAYSAKINAVASEAALETTEFAQRFSKCEILRNNICVSVNGDVYPCPGWQAMVVGNIREQSLQEIWLNAPKVIELRNFNKDDLKKCRVCELKNYCDMCLVYNYNENGGDMYNVCTRFCDIAMMLKNRVKQKYNEIKF